MYYFTVVYGHFEDQTTWFVVFYVYVWDSIRIASTVIVCPASQPVGVRDHQSIREAIRAHNLSIGA